MIIAGVYEVVVAASVTTFSIMTTQVVKSISGSCLSILYGGSSSVVNMSKALTFVFEDIVHLFDWRFSDKHALLLVLRLIPVITHISLNEVAAVSHFSPI